MFVIPPVDIINNTSLLQHSSVPLNSGSDPSTNWSITTVYTEGTRVIDGDKIYVCTTAVSGGSRPSSDIYATVPKWSEEGYVNRLKMFDLYSSSKTTSASTIVLTIKPGTRVDTISIINAVNVTSIEVSAVDATNTTVYATNTVAVTSSHISILDLPLISSIVISISIYGTGTMEIGTLVVGRKVYLGDIQSGFSIDTVNFSTIERDEFGSISLIPRASVLKIPYRLFIQTKYIHDAVNARYSTNSIPCVWLPNLVSSLERYEENMVLIGIYRSFKVNMESPIHSIIELEVEEL